MKKVKVISIDNYIYTFEDKDQKKYIKNIEFQDTEINIGDYIYISKEVLEEDNIYTYGPVTKDAKLEDLIKIKKDDKDIYLQRYYG